MHVAVIYHMFSSEKGRRHLRFQLILQCAPFLKGLKISSMINVEKSALNDINKVFEEIGIEWKILKEQRGKCLLFLYRRREFTNYLHREEIRRFLEENEYCVDSVDKLLERLSKRVSEYEERNFPHEIGVFLDYPIEDVKAFIEKNGKDYLMCGYWKVYYNPDRAQRIFHIYDMAKVSAVNEFLAGGTLRDIVRKSSAEMTQ